MNKNDNLIGYVGQQQIAFQGEASFYGYEQDEYPNGGSPFGDIHRELYVAGYVAHSRECMDMEERT